MKRTPTRPWEIRNDVARRNWIARGRERLTISGMLLKMKAESDACPLFSAFPFANQSGGLVVLGQGDDT